MGQYFGDPDPRDLEPQIPPRGYDGANDPLPPISRSPGIAAKYSQPPFTPESLGIDSNNVRWNAEAQRWELARADEPGAEGQDYIAQVQKLNDALAALEGPAPVKAADHALAIAPVVAVVAAFVALAVLYRWFRK